jgi:hypothetical protein
MDERIAWLADARKWKTAKNAAFPDAPVVADQGGFATVGPSRSAQAKQASSDVPMQLVATRCNIMSLRATQEHELTVATGCTSLVRSER